MGALRERLSWSGGAVNDGPRRYLLMRPDVLMGAALRMSESARTEWLAALAESTRVQGGDSLRAYAQSVAGDAAALMHATAEAAADLGWGRWRFERDDESLTLQVQASPFVAGWCAAGGGVAAQPLCAPVQGMLAALATLVLQAEVQVRELRCAGCQASGEESDTCRFEARRPRA